MKNQHLCCLWTTINTIISLRLQENTRKLIEARVSMGLHVTYKYKVMEVKNKKKLKMENRNIL